MDARQSAGAVTPLLVIHDEDEIRPLQHLAFTRASASAAVPADRTSRSARLLKMRSAVGLRMRLCRHRNSTRVGGGGVAHANRLILADASTHRRRAACRGRVLAPARCRQRAARLPLAPAAARQNAERHLRNIRKLTSGGENAEAYFSTDGTGLIYQSTRPEYPCDQIYTMSWTAPISAASAPAPGGRRAGISIRPGTRSCSRRRTRPAPRARRVRASSAATCGRSTPSYDIYRANADGTNLRPLTRTPGYDAEATIAPDGLIVFTSVRDGDMEIYTMKADGSDVKRLTNRPGPDGGPFFSWDGKSIVFRGRQLAAGQELDDYRALLKEGLWRPTQLELFVMDRDGPNLRQVTKLGGANFAPSWHPDGKRLIFASNIDDPKGRNFDLYLINVDGTGLERVTFNGTFDGFPMFSPDGKQLVFASNRQCAGGRGDERLHRGLGGVVRWSASTAGPRVACRARGCCGS